jgi:hypothetical protein
MEPGAEVLIIRLAVEENAIGLDMAVAVIAPFAGQRVIENSGAGAAYRRRAG